MSLLLRQGSPSLLVGVTAYDGDPNDGGAPTEFINAKDGTCYIEQTLGRLWVKYPSAWQSTDVSVLLPQVDDPFAPTLAIGDVSTGIYAPSVGNLNTALSGVILTRLTANGLGVFGIPPNNAWPLYVRVDASSPKLVGMINNAAGTTSAASYFAGCNVASVSMGARSSAFTAMQAGIVAANAAVLVTSGAAHMFIGTGVGDASPVYMMTNDALAATIDGVTQVFSFEHTPKFLKPLPVFHSASDWASSTSTKVVVGFATEAWQMAEVANLIHLNIRVPEDWAANTDPRITLHWGGLDTSAIGDGETVEWQCEWQNLTTGLIQDNSPVLLTDLYTQSGAGTAGELAKSEIISFTLDRADGTHGFSAGDLLSIRLKMTNIGTYDSPSSVALFVGSTLDYVP